MIENNFIVFQTASGIVKKTYKNELNYKIHYSEIKSSNKNLCVIYFSSNEIYYPNTNQSFEKSIIVKDKYEWVNSKFPNAYKHIFLRDIQKQWYIEGINTEINTPTKLLQLLEQETNGYTVFTIGSSAGGFAAMLYGSMLNAKRVYAFNAQMNLNLVIAKSTRLVDPLLFKYKDKSESKFYNLDNYINKNTEYFYFQSAKSSYDIEQFNVLDFKINVNHIRFNTSNHGFPFFRHNIQHIFASTNNDLLKLTKTQKNPFLYSVECDGFFKSILLISKAVLLRFKKKMIDEKMNK